MAKYIFKYLNILNYFEKKDKNMQISPTRFYYWSVDIYTWVLFLTY